MSEFSESYHFFTNEQEKAVKLIKSLNKEGYVFPSKDNWTTFVLENSSIGEVMNSMEITDNDILLYFINSEDHGWEASLFKGSKRVYKYSSYRNDQIDYLISEDIIDPEDESSFEQEIEVDERQYIYNCTVEEQLLSHIFLDISDAKRKQAVIEKTINAANSEKNINPSKTTLAEFNSTIERECVMSWEFADEMGLFFYSWVSYDYVSLDYEEGECFNYGKLGSFELIKVE